MKILIRVLGLSIIAIIVAICSIYLINTNIIANELNDASALAMINTQDKMKQVVVSRLDREEKDLFSGTTYKDYYIDCFKELVEDETKYDINVEADYSKGIIYALIETPNYKLVPTKRLINIINVEGENLEDIESHYYEEVKIEELNKISKTRWMGVEARTLETWKFDEEVKVLKADIELYGIESRSSNPNTIIGPAVELRCIDEDGKTTVIDEDEGGYHQSSFLESEECYECKLVDLVVTKDIDPSKYGLKTDAIYSYKNCGIYIEKTSIVEKEDYKLSEDVEIYSRYISDINSLKDNSIWLQDNNYTEVLKEYIKK